MRGAITDHRIIPTSVGFQLTLPMRGAIGVPRVPSRPHGDFNSHSPCGERSRGASGSSRSTIFQLTLPMRGAIHPGRGARHPPVISTHTPHAGSDTSAACRRPASDDFNSHSPCGERSSIPKHVTAAEPISTHTPHAGSDRGQGGNESQVAYFNSRSPCGERYQ